MHALAAIWNAILAYLGFGSPNFPPPPPPSYLVRSVNVADEKSVFATVESINTVSARARIAGTVITLSVKQGDWVNKGQLIGYIADKKLNLQANSYAAQEISAKAQMEQAGVEYQRSKRLLEEKAISRNAFEQSRTAYEVARANVQSVAAQKSVILQQSKEGRVLAPTSGRVITVPLTAGSVVVSGDTIATVAEQHFKLRLKLPEAYAHNLKIGTPIRLDGTDIGQVGMRTGRVTLVYPGIENGHVAADAEVNGVSDYFVSERVRTFVTLNNRSAIIVPERLVKTHAGIDYVRILEKSGSGFESPVQRGQRMITRAGPCLEILSGLHAGDRLLEP